MRITFILLMVMIFRIDATKSYSQSATVNLSGNSMSIEELITEVEKQTSYLFLYIEDDLDLSRQVKVKAMEKPIKDLLEDVFTGTDIVYSFNEEYISLRKKTQDEVKVTKKVVTGTVVDNLGDPMIGVNVVEKGTTNGVVTDLDGNFSLSVDESSTLQFSYVGYVAQEVSARGKQQFSVVMTEDSRSLSEVVIVGYGTQKKSNVTGSVTSIKPGDFNDLNMDVTSILQGRVAGVNVSNGNIIIRGAASINSSDPLWIVDGIPGGAPNVNDIESIEILKDAASTAIYGARGAGGVILVTTKKGTVGKIQVNARVNLGVSLPIDIPDLLQTPDFIDRKKAAGFAVNPDSGWDNPELLPNTNWADYIWQNAFRQNYYVQLSGGNEMTSFTTSAEYTKNERVEQGAYDSAASLRFASQTKLSRKLKITEIVTLGFNNNSPTVFGNESSSKIFYRSVPTMDVYDNLNTAGGGWGKQPAGGYYEGPNPAAILGSVHANNRTYKGGANLILDFEIIKNLMFQTTLSGNYSSYANNNFQEHWNSGNFTQEQRYTKDYGEAYNLRMLYTLTYSHTFADKHDFRVMAGYEAYKAESSSAGGWKTGFSVEPVEDMNLGSGSSDATGGKGMNRSISQFARLNYAYDDKYMFEASVRRDGYDNFGPKNRFGVFPSASAGWNIARENFIKDNVNMNWLTQMKLRGSIGRIGNNTVGQFLYEPSFTSNYLYYAYDQGTTSRGFWYSNIPNEAIKWEDVRQWNIGLDASFLNNRLNTTIEYYDKKTSDMLYTIGAPSSAGAYSSSNFSLAPSYTANIGQISNKGFEWMIQWRDSFRDFKYDVAFTLSTNKNKVIKLSDEINPVIWQGSSTAINSSIYRTENGQPMGQMYGYVVEGIFQNQSEIDALNSKSPDGIYQQTGTAPGDLKYRDVNKDGKITEEDKDVIGNPWPKVIYGLNMNFSWRGFDLNMGWTANMGMDIFNSAKVYERSFYGDFNTTYRVYDAWSTENTATSHPRVTNTDPNNNFRNVSSYLVENGSFLKLKNLHFGYNLPKSLLTRFHVQGLKVFVNCDNIWIISKFQGDPEIGGGYLQRNHYTEKRLPKTRSVIGGLSITM